MQATGMGEIGIQQIVTGEMTKLPQLAAASQCDNSLASL